MGVREGLAILLIKFLPSAPTATGVKENSMGITIIAQKF
jgi:hypothetical protein